jgi:hypothetical protein
VHIGLPRDTAQVLSVGAAALLVAAGPWLLRGAARRPRVFVAALAACAAALSAGYVVVYLRGGPRIIDATSYWLEARALAAGLVRIPLGDPAASTLGRFMVRPADDPAHGAVIFPPGYPALLALGSRLGAPLAVGPALAAALAVATYDLAARVSGDPAVARVAAMLSVVCAALRYHTADTMSHGLAALCFAASLALLFRAEDRPPASRGAFALAVASGAFLGWLAATRPVSALALGAVVAWAATSGGRARLLAGVAFGALPGLALLVLHQRAATGTAWTSSQFLYYEMSDGPPGCFRYAFGEGIGCLGEHGDFVRARLSDGYGLAAALGTTLRRLKMHLVDAGNVEIVALFVPVAAALTWRERRARALALGVAAVVAAYAPFYFDGNYPGGGARFFADVLPLEHALVAGGAARLVRTRYQLAPVALSLAGFAFRAGFDHAALRDRDGGRPMFLAADLAGAGVRRGLFYVNTDHAHALGFDPTGRAPLEVLRLRGDDLDLMAWDARGRPPAFQLLFDPASGDRTLQPFPLERALEGPLSIEGESLWPPRGQRGAWALPVHAGDACVSRGRLLQVASQRGGAVELDLPARWLRGRSLTLRAALGKGAAGRIRIVADGATLSTWALEARAEGSPEVRCPTGESTEIPDRTADLRLVVELKPVDSKALFALDRLDSGPAKSVDRHLGKVRDSQGIQ